MKVFLFILIGLCTISYRSEAAGPAECMAIPNLRYDAGALTSYALVKEGCTLRFIVSGGKTEKLEVPLCQIDTQIKQFMKMDDTEPKYYKPNSKDCPRPLANGETNSPEEFANAKKRIFEIFEQVADTYGLAKPEELLRAVDVTKANSELKMACFKAVLNQYLEKCVALPEIKIEEIKPPEAPKSIPMGVHPEMIELQQQH